MMRNKRIRPPLARTLAPVMTALAVACGGGGTAEDIDLTADTDGDGVTDVDERDRYGTSIHVRDTDGDGFSDFEEIFDKGFDPAVNATQFNPLVADVPRLNIRLTSLPDLAMVYTEGSETAKTVGTEHSNATTQGTVRSWGGSNTYAVEMTHTAGVEVSVSHEFGLLGGTSVSGSLSYEFSHSTTNESTTDWSQEQSTENTRALTEIESAESRESVEVQGGAVSTTVEIENVGDIAFIMEDLTLSAFIDNPQNPIELGPVGNLVYVDNSAVFPATVVPPGDRTAPLNFSANVNLATIKSVLRDSKNLVIAPATGVLRGDGDRSFELAATNINARTAEIIIDYGLERPQESYRVATIVDRDNPGVTVKEALQDVLQIPYTIGKGLWMYGDDAAPSETFEGLTSLRDVQMSADDLQYWIVAHTYSTEAGAGSQTDYYNLVLDGYDLENLVLQKGHVLHFVRVRDRDRDGLGDRAEHLHGTDPLDADTDGDGCSDALEVGGWEIEVDGRSVRVFPSPLLIDSDLDGTNDCDEYEAQPRTDPTERGANQPPVITSLSANVDGLSVDLDVAFREPDAIDRVVSLRVDWGDGTEDTFEVPEGRSQVTVRHTYGASAAYTVRVAAFDGLDEGPEATLGVDLGLPERGLVRELLFTDGQVADTSSNPGDVWLQNDLACIFEANDRHGLENQAVKLNVDDGAAACGLDGTGVIEFENPGVQHSFTIAAWVYSRSPSQSQWIIGQPGRFFDDRWARMVLSRDVFTEHGASEQVSFVMPDPSGDASRDLVLTDPTDLEREVWVMYAVTVEAQAGSTTARLYRDGVEVATETRAVVYNNPSMSDHWSAGAHNYEDGSSFFQGRLDDLRVYDRALSAVEVGLLTTD